MLTVTGPRNILLRRYDPNNEAWHKSLAVGLFVEASGVTRVPFASLAYSQHLTRTPAFRVALCGFALGLAPISRSSSPRVPSECIRHATNGLQSFAMHH
jgi:hypothetical protein